MTEMADLYARTDSGLAAYAAGFLHNLPPALWAIRRHQRAIMALLEISGINPETLDTSNSLDTANTGAFSDGQEAAASAASFYALNHQQGHDDDVQVIDPGWMETDTFVVERCREGHVHIALTGATMVFVDVVHRDGSESTVAIKTDENREMAIGFDPANDHEMTPLNPRGTEGYI